MFEAKLTQILGYELKMNSNLLCFTFDGFKNPRSDGCWVDLETEINHMTIMLYAKGKAYVDED